MPPTESKAGKMAKSMPAWIAEGQVNVPLKEAAGTINVGFVLGNKVVVGTVNAGREHYEVAVQDMALAESQYPGWLSRLLTHPIAGLDNYRKTFMRLSGDSQANKVFVEVVPLM